MVIDFFTAESGLLFILLSGQLLVQLIILFLLVGRR